MMCCSFRISSGPKFFYTTLYAHTHTCNIYMHIFLTTELAPCAISLAKVETSSAEGNKMGMVLVGLGTTGISTFSSMESEWLGLRTVEPM